MPYLRYMCLFAHNVLLVSLSCVSYDASIPGMSSFDGPSVISNVYLVVSLHFIYEVLLTKIECSYAH